MKSFKRTLVAAVAVSLLASPAFALIGHTKHDLSSGSGNTIVGTSDEICVYCHTPHGAASVADAPLWNRTTPAVTSIYTSNSIDATITLTEVQASDAPLCLSCHDGASMTAALNNTPNAGGGNPAANIGAVETNLGTDLSNDHPVGFVFTTALVDSEIQTPSTAPVDFGSGSNEMWCSSCHDVHDDSNPPFLVMSNTGSDLCLDCHKK
ncbi:MAG: cytochrome C [Desulfuromonas sp.]|nr:MAG: cytochrome C [Desulfuromonas sp.]